MNPNFKRTLCSLILVLITAPAMATSGCMGAVAPAMKQGHQLFKQEKFIEALPLFKQSLDTCRAANDRSGISAGLFGYGHTLYMINRFEESEKALLEGWSIRQTLNDGDPDNELLIYPNELMYLYRQWGRFDLAWQWGEFSLAAKARVNGAETNSYAIGASNLSGVALQTKDYARGLPYAMQGMNIWNKLSGENSTDHAWGMRDVGILLFRMGRTDQAFGYLNKAYEIRLREFGEHRTETQTSIADMAAWYTATGNDRMALEFAEKAVAIARARSGADSFETSVALARVVGIALRLGQPAQASSAAETSLAIRRKLFGDTHHYTVGAWQEAAMAAIADNRLGRAELAARTAVTHCRVVYVSTPASCAGHQITHARTLLALGEAATALETARAAAQLAQGPNFSSDQAAAELLAAQAEGALGRLDAMLGALAALKERIAATPRPFGTMLDEVHQATLLARAERASARELTELATQAELLAARVADTRGIAHPAYGSALLNAGGMAQRLGQLDRARRHGARALAIAMGNRDTMLEARAATLLGALDHGASAIFLGKQAVNALQSSRAGTTSLAPALQNSFVRQKSAAYVQLADRLLDQRRIQEAETVLAMVREDQFHSMVRSDADARTTRLAFTGTESALQHTVAQQADTLRRGADELASARTRQAQGASDGDTAFRAAQTAMAGLLDRATDALAHLNTMPFAPTATAPVGAATANTQSGTLPPGELRLTYLVTANRVRIVAQQANVATVHDMDIDERQLARQIARLRHSAQHPGRDARSDARALYRLLLEPVAPALKRARTLTVAPGGVLRYLPFAMLHDGRQWLVQRLPVKLSYSAGVDSTAAPVARTASLALFGQSQASGELPALPFVRSELLAVHAAGQGRRVPSKTYLDQQFTAAALEQALPVNSTVHIASHFVLRSGLGRDSYLLMGDGAQLSLAELGAARFRFDGLDLLTLSACETAVPAGTDDSGRELEGLAWLARQRGARHVLASLWRVSDQSTATLMGNFYKALAAGASKAQALRAAQLRQIRAVPGVARATRSLKVLDAPRELGAPVGEVRNHPFYWAGFVLLGS